jgi:hypothetical protein
MKYEIISEVKNGKLIRNKKMIREVIESFEGKEIALIIEQKYQKRTIKQNSYLHGYLFPVITNALNELGWDMTPNKTKEWLKKRFLIHTEINHETGEYLEWVKKTSDCNTKEINDFQEKCIMFAAEELGIVVALPGEQINLI